MQKLAVLGSPITHSKSPALHRAAYKTLGLADWQYEAVEITEPGLAQFLKSRDESWRGFSLTMPLKLQALALADEHDLYSGITGVANTLYRVDGGWTAFNTDVGGIARAFSTAGIASVPHGIVIGGGATAASAITALSDLGAERVDVFVRSPGRAESLTGLGNRSGLMVTIHEMHELEKTNSADAVICTLPGGTNLNMSLPRWLSQAAVLLDVAYSPWPTPIANQWLDGTGQVISGLSMLLYQAVLQVRIFVNGDPTQALANEDEVIRVMRSVLDI